jgi:hypothetical protein
VVTSFELLKRHVAVLKLYWELTNHCAVKSISSGLSLDTGQWPICVSGTGKVGGDLCRALAIRALDGNVHCLWATSRPARVSVERTLTLRVLVFSQISSLSNSG